MAQKQQKEAEKSGIFDDTNGRNKVSKQKVDKMNRVNLAESLRLLNRTGDDPAILVEQRRP